MKQVARSCFVADVSASVRPREWRQVQIRSYLGLFENANTLIAKPPVS